MGENGEAAEHLKRSARAGSLLSRCLHLGRLLAVLSILLFGGCRERELYTTTDRSESYAILLTLADAGIAAEETAGRGRIAIYVAKSDFQRAVRALHERGLPASADDSVAELTKTDGLAPAPLELSALRYDAALGREVERILQTLPGVVDVKAAVRSKLALPLPGREKTTADVTIRHSGSPAVSAEKVRERVRALVPGAENVTVTFQEAGAASGKREALTAFSPFSFKVSVYDRQTAKREVYVVLLVVMVSALTLGALIGYAVAISRRSQRGTERRGTQSFRVKKR